MILTFKIENNITVKEYLEKQLTSKLLRNDNIHFIVNNQSVKNYYMMSNGDILNVVIPPSSSDVVAVKGELDILYEDDYLLILNKPKDMATIPTRKHYKSSLANIVQYYYITKGIFSGIHFVNRLDAPTSGIVVVAKNQYIADKMKTLIKEKKYLLKSWGQLLEDGSIKTTIVKDENSIIKRKNIEGTNSFTTYKVLKVEENKTLIEATLHTGRTHQLRLHFNYLGHNIIGDKLYGSDDVDTLHLHSYYIKFIHPITNNEIVLKSLPTWYSLE